MVDIYDNIISNISKIIILCLATFLVVGSVIFLRPAEFKAIAIIEPPRYVNSSGEIHKLMDNKELVALIRSESFTQLLDKHFRDSKYPPFQKKSLQVIPLGKDYVELTFIDNDKQVVSGKIAVAFTGIKDMVIPIVKARNQAAELRFEEVRKQIAEIQRFRQTTQGSRGKTNPNKGNAKESLGWSISSQALVSAMSRFQNLSLIYAQLDSALREVRQDSLRIVISPKIKPKATFSAKIKKTILLGLLSSFVLTFLFLLLSLSHTESDEKNVGV